MEKNKNRVKTKLIKMIQKYEKYKRISDSMEYSESRWYNHCQNRTWWQRSKIELFMLENYSVNDAVASDVLNKRITIDDFFKKFDEDSPDNSRNPVLPYSLPNKVYYGWRFKYIRYSIEHKKLQKYYDIQRKKQGWCYLDIIDVSYSLNAIIAGMLETYVCKVPDYHTPCYFFVEEYFKKHDGKLSMTFEEYDKYWWDYELKDFGEKTTEFEKITNQVREYQFKTIRDLAEVIRLGADNYRDHGGKRVEDAKNAIRKVLEFYDELED